MLKKTGETYLTKQTKQTKNTVCVRRLNSHTGVIYDLVQQIECSNRLQRNSLKYKSVVAQLIIKFVTLSNLHSF